MTSPNFESVVADANVLLSAGIRRAALRVFAFSKLKVFTTQDVMDDVKKYLGGLAEKNGMLPQRAEQRLRALPIVVVPESEYADKLEEAKRYMAERDPDDAPILALALKLEVSLWSNDNDFENAPVTVYPTAALLKVLGL